jgi:DNA (cytosine-5)-methyltransferase 1
MIYGSVCSGIEAATMAWHHLGWRPAFFSEIEAFPSAVLAHHYGSNMPGEPPARNGVPNLGDLSRYAEWPDMRVDLIVGGTPCQDSSVGFAAGAGRAGDGLDGARSGLAFSFVGLLRRYRPKWFVWENVPNNLTPRLAPGFLRFGHAIADIGYHLAWRVLDARGFRISDQPRPRLFVVGALGPGDAAEKILLDSEGPRGNRAEEEKAAPVLTARGGMAFDDRTPCILESEGPRIATPDEWERAMGFPGGFTRIPWNGRPKDRCPDGPRYRSVGNSMSIDVIRWIGGRIDLFEREVRPLLQTGKETP